MSLRIGDCFSSLSFKLPAVYVISVLLLVVSFVALLNFINTSQAYDTIKSTLEIGPGYLNGVTPDKVKPPAPDHLKAKRVISDYTAFSSVSDKGVVDGNGILIEYTLTGDGTGPVTLYRDDFPRTFDLEPVNILPERAFYFLRVPGHSDALLVASVDYKGVQALEAAEHTLHQSIYLSPVILALAILFGWFVSRKTVTPIREIAKAAENISEKNLSQRVKFHSKDEIGSLARTFNRMADRLENSISSRKRFFSDAAHELKTPLASIKTSVTYALSERRSLKEYQENLRFISARIYAMEMLVKDLLFLAKADEGNMTTSKSIVDLCAVVGEAEEAFRPLFEEKGIRLFTRSEKGLFVYIERRLLLRLITNLLDNASKNVAQNGLVSITAGIEGQNILVIISDTGIGIPPEHVDKVFDRFYKVPGSSISTSGSGLGLSICKKIVTEGGGEISLRSYLGKGSVFKITLPRAKKE